MNLKYLFYGIIVTTTLQLKSAAYKNKPSEAEPKHNLTGRVPYKRALETLTKKERMAYRSKRRDYLDREIENLSKLFSKQGANHKKFLDDLKEKSEDESIQQGIREVEKQLSYLHHELIYSREELDKLLEILYE